MKNEREGVIVRFLRYVTEFLHYAITHSLLGRLFTSFDASERALQVSVTGHAAGVSGNRKLHRAVRWRIAYTIEHNAVLRFVRWLLRKLCECSLRTVGLFFLTAGCYSAVMYWITDYVWHYNAVTWVSLVTGVASALVGVLMLFSDDSLGYALGKGLFFKGVLSTVFGVPDDILRDFPREGRQGYVIAVPLGMAVGAVFSLLDPTLVFAVIGALLLLLLTLSVPEAGVMLLFFFLPFVGIIAKGHIAFLLIAVLLPLVGYVAKLLRGNRAFHLSVQDLPVAVLILAVLLSGFFSIGIGAWRTGILTALFMSAYFLVVNTIATPGWATRCRLSLLISASISGVIGIIQFIVAAVNGGGALTATEIGRAVCGGFTDNAVFAGFLVIVFPFAAIDMMYAKRNRRIFSATVCLLILTAAVLTFVQSAWFAIFLSLFFFLLIYDYRLFPAILAGGGIAATAIAILPAHARRAASAFLTESTRLAAGDDAIRRGIGNIFFSGGEGVFSRGAGFSRLLFGVGVGGFERAFALFSDADPARAVASVNLPTHLLCELGVTGLILPAAFCLLLLQNCFSLLADTSADRRSVTAVAGIALMAGGVFFSFFRYVWYDYASLSLAFAAFGLVVAELRRERDRGAAVMQETYDETFAEIDYYGNS